jgi:hypothetical protein
MSSVEVVGYGGDGFVTVKSYISPIISYFSSPDNYENMSAVLTSPQPPFDFPVKTVAPAHSPQRTSHTLRVVGRATCDSIS